MHHSRSERDVVAYGQHNPEGNLHPAARSPQAPIDHRHEKAAEERRKNLAFCLQLQPSDDLELRSHHCVCICEA